MKNFIEEFKKFAVKGNAMDLAIGVIIGAAFGKIVSSLTNNILTPLLSILAGGKNFESLSLVIGDVHIQYGLFISAIIDFIIIALILFIFVKFIIKARKKNNEEKQEKSQELKILEEIRDILKNK